MTENVVSHGRIFGLGRVLVGYADTRSSSAEPDRPTVTLWAATGVDDHGAVLSSNENETTGEKGIRTLRTGSPMMRLVGKVIAKTP